jgi:hypothetical protein
MSIDYLIGLGTGLAASYTAYILWAADNAGLL